MGVVHVRAAVAHRPRRAARTEESVMMAADGNAEHRRLDAARPDLRPLGESHDGVAAGIEAIDQRRAMTDAHPHRGRSGGEAGGNEPVRVTVAIDLLEGPGRGMAQLQVALGPAAAAEDPRGVAVYIRSRIAQGQPALRAGRGQRMGEQRLPELLLLPEQGTPPLAGDYRFLEVLGLVDDLGQRLAGLWPGEQVAAGPGPNDLRFPDRFQEDGTNQDGNDQAYFPQVHLSSLRENP